MFCRFKSGCRRRKNIVGNHEKADTKMVLYTLHALAKISEGNVIIRTHSGDTDIVAILLASFSTNEDRLFVNSNKCRNREFLCQYDADIGRKEVLAFLVCYASTGNDNVSVFFRKRNICA